MSTIYQGNKLIAEFMGKTYREDSGDGEEGYPFPRNGNFGRRLMPGSMRYHLDWGWLMEVERMIYGMRFETMGNIMLCEFLEFKEATEVPMYTKLSETWKIIVNFIIWYNECKKK